jgi:hypothetical protein
MAQAAEEVGLSYERFRKVWPSLPGFPAPIAGRRWDAEALAAWKAARSRLGDALEGRTATAAGSRAGQRGRVQLQLLRAS